ncbi:MAG: sugar phosphate isomerase/epimerase [Eubacteriales bacterium]
MKLSLFTHTYMDRSFSATLDIVKSKGVSAVEIGAGGLLGKTHCNPCELLADESRRKAFEAEYKSRGMEIAGLSVHGNPLHPDKKIADAHSQDIREAIRLASLLGIKQVIGFSGCPEGAEGDTTPNWPVAPWPLDFQDVLAYQWDKKLVPFWKEMGQFALDHSVRFAFEMHGGFSVHTPATMVRLREETGMASLGANVDPSHLWWQGIDPAMAIRHLAKADCLFYFHAKDTRIEQSNVDYYGLTDMQPYTNVLQRAWQFRTIGYGHDMNVWANMLSTLRMAGYDGYISVEHEDALMSMDEGLDKALENIRSVIMLEDADIPKMFAK